MTNIRAWPIIRCLLLSRSRLCEQDDDRPVWGNTRDVASSEKRTATARHERPVVDSLGRSFSVSFVMVIALAVIFHRKQQIRFEARARQERLRYATVIESLQTREEDEHEHDDDGRCSTELTR
jgi:hypothetical protein